MTVEHNTTGGILRPRLRDTVVTKPDTLFVPTHAGRSAVTATICPKSFSPIAGKRLSVVGHTTGVGSRLVITILVGDTGRPLFAMRRQITLLRRYYGSVPGIAIRDFSNLAMRFTGGHHTSIVIQNLQTIASFRGRVRLTRAGRTLVPNVRAVFLTADVG